MTTQTLGDLLVEEQVIEPSELAGLQRRARLDGNPLVVALVDEGHLSEGALRDLLVRRLHLPIADLVNTTVEQDAVREVTLHLAQAHWLVPLAVERREGRRVLRVAMADPLDGEAIDEIESSTGCRVEPLVATLSEVEPAIERAYRGFVTKLIHRRVEAAERAPQPAEPTQPRRHIVDVAPVELRLRALVKLLVDKGVIADEEYREAVRRLLEADADGDEN